MTKNLIFWIAFIFYPREVLKQDHYMTHLLSYAKHHFEMQQLQKPLVYSSTSMSIFLTFLLYLSLTA